MAKKKAPAEPVVPAPAPPVLESLCELETQLAGLQEPVAQQLQAVLDRLATHSLGSLAANQAVVDALQRLLYRLNLRVACPRCDAPSIPRCRATGNAKDGSFQFEHPQRGRRTNHGGSTTFPKVRLVAAPDDPRRERKKRRE